MNDLAHAVREAAKQGCDGWYSNDDPPDADNGERGFWVPWEAWRHVVEQLDRLDPPAVFDGGDDEG